MTPSRFREVLQQADHFIRRERLLEPGESVLVGFSGGPDSTALLALLASMRRKQRLRLIAAHLDHGIRKDVSRRHLRAARDTCRRLDVPLVVRSASVKALAAKQGRSLEEAGRIARYTFFEETARKRRCSKIATAHTLDDQAETLLLHLLRGAGLRGLGGIPPQRPLGVFTVVRPLLGCRKKDLLAAVEEEGLRFCVDPSNADPAFSRNAVRNWLLPNLSKRFNPRITETLASMRDVCAQVQDYLDGESARAWRACRKSRKGILRLAIDSLTALHPALRREVILRAISEKKGDLRKIGHGHVAAVSAILSSREGGLSLDLPDGLRVRKSRGWLEFDTPSK